MFFGSLIDDSCRLHRQRPEGLIGIAADVCKILFDHPLNLMNQAKNHTIHEIVHKLA